VTCPIYVVGASGATYSYVPLHPDIGASRRAGNYLFARLTAEGPQIALAGESENLSAVDWEGIRAQAQTGHDAAAVLVRLNVSRAVRQAEHQDLIERHHPPMNTAPRT